MNVDDLIWGCRSALQKAIRRRDLDLAHTAFNLLWSEKEHRNWLQWRMATLVMEEAWQMSGELAEFLDSETNSEKDWRRFVYKLTLCSKSKDAMGLWFLPYYHNALQSKEMELVSFWINRMVQGEPSSIADGIFEECIGTIVAGEPLSHYEKAAIKVLRKRIDMGGMFVDRCFCLSGMILIAMRGLRKDDILLDIKAGKEKWLKRVNRRDKPRTINLPWYVFDKHTRVGMAAIKIFMEHKAAKYPGLTEEKFRSIWFYIESAYSPIDSLCLKPKEDYYTAFDSIYWLPLLNRELRYSHNGPKKVKKIWDSKMRKQIRVIVEEVLESRDNKNEIA